MKSRIQVVVCIVRQTQRMSLVLGQTETRLLLCQRRRLIDTGGSSVVLRFVANYRKKLMLSMLNRMLIAAVSTFVLFFSSAALALDTYDGYALSIPKVLVGDIFYTNVSITVGSVLQVNGGETTRTFDIYDAPSNQLRIAAVAVGSTIYRNVVITVGSVLSVGGAQIQVKNSSYENKIAAGQALGSQEIPLDWKPCADRAPCSAFPASAVAFADFLGKGSYSMITHTIDYNGENILDKGRKGKIKLYENMQGKWVENTSLILKPEDAQGCLHARKALVADFMQNGRPSVFFSCYGCDGDGPNCRVSAIGESQRILLAQSDGTFKNVEITLPTLCACHSASAADINGDGYPDILLVDYYLNKSVFVLINNKDGTFTPDYSRFPSEYTRKAMFTAELIDFRQSGQYDAFISGAEECCEGVNFKASIFSNDGKGQFKSPPITLPSIAGFGNALDVLYANGNIYLNRTIDNPSDSHGYYGGFLLQKINYKTLASEVLYKSYTAFSTGEKWLDWLIFNGTNVVSLGSIYKFSQPM